MSPRNQGRISILSCLEPPKGGDTEAADGVAPLGLMNINAIAHAWGLRTRLYDAARPGAENPLFFGPAEPDSNERNIKMCASVSQFAAIDLSPMIAQCR